MLPGYRFSKTGSLQNPYASDANVGATTKDAIFVNQLLNPYIKNDGVWRCPSALTSWVNINPSGTKDAFQSYGGQNSYAVSNYTFRSNNGIASAAIAAPADTVGMVDATYYNSLPYGPKSGAGPCKLAGEGAYGQVGGPVDPTSGSYPHYWKHIGNSVLDFNSLGTKSPLDATNASKIDAGKARHNGQINVMFLDGHSKSINYDALVFDPNLVVGSTTSIWDPYKQGCAAATQ